MSTNETAREEVVLSREAEERLLDLGREVFGSGFPDPERSAGISSAMVKAAARRSHREPLPAELVDALTWSSETFTEYERYVREARFARRMGYLAACAAIVVALGAAMWWSVGSMAPSPDEPPPIVEDNQTPRRVPAPEVVPDSPGPESTPEPTVEVAALDLRGRSPVRGETVPDTGDLPVIPAGRLDLTVTLPIGSEEGEYDVAVLSSPGAPLMTAQAQAKLADQNVVLPTRIDLSDVEPGRYYLGVRRGEFPWSYYGIEVR